MLVIVDKYQADASATVPCPQYNLSSVLYEYGKQIAIISDDTNA